ncbi:unnamed protein product [Leptidea sinapis]|uniref:Uncharacterized protein n=1 Tax=Leptidea sinapis TaxID=189913 RepID=A0A5E4QAA3_9NEOP|nr:unnamed protein product [Leptidea sinapis]
MFAVSRNISLLLRRNNKPEGTVRYFWEYVNMMFNKPDPDRIKTVGPDRACAEWVLRNGGKVVWANGKALADYNSLPPDSEAVPKVAEIDGSESSISHYGFPHLDGCVELWKITLHDNKYIDDRAMKGLEHGKEALKHLQVSKCVNVTDEGLKDLISLSKLQTLVLYNLPSVNKLEECTQIIVNKLPNCKIIGGAEKLQD